MKFMKNKKTARAAGVFFLMIMLTACSHENPLSPKNNEKSIHTSAQFLYEVAVGAQPLLAKQYPEEVKRYKIIDGAVFYDLCITNDYFAQDKKLLCTNFYNDMVMYANSKKSFLSKDVVLNDVKNLQMWSMIKEDYYHLAYPPNKDGII